MEQTTNKSRKKQQNNNNPERTNGTLNPFCRAEEQKRA